MTGLSDKIRSRGYWQIFVSPADFVESRVPYSELRPLIERSSVDLRGWDFPHIDPHEPIQTNTSWIEQESEWHQFKEIWRLHQSGQFLDLLSIWEDWYDESQLDRIPDGWEPMQRLGVSNTIYHFTEIYEFASRLARTVAGSEVMTIGITATGLKNRFLWQENLRRVPFRFPRSTAMSEFLFEKAYSKLDLSAQPREFALEPIEELFARFEWSPGLERLREWQSQIGKW